MRRPDLRPLSFLLALILCLGAFTLPTFASYDSDESGSTEPPAYAGSVITITAEEMGDMPEDPEADGELTPEAEPEPENTDALTPEGNLTLVDDIVQSDGAESKQFLTVTSKSGNYFYLIVDRSGDKQNVHFLNLVDESDLLALMEDEEKEAAKAVCTCKDKCYAGHVNTTCPVCAVNMTECSGKEPEPTPTPTPTPTEQVTQQKKRTSGPAILLLVLVLGGGAAFYFLKVRKVNLPFKKPSVGDSSSREPENEEADDEFLEFEKSDEEEPDDLPAPYTPDNGEYWPEDDKDGPVK